MATADLRRGCQTAHDSTPPDARLLGAYYDLWFEKVHEREQKVGYSPSDRYNDAVKHRLLRAEVEQQLSHPGSAWLDYGCGPAELFARYQVPPDCQRVGIDISPATIVTNRARFAGEGPIRFGTTDDGTLEQLAPGSLDCITCIEVLEHVYGAEAIIDAFARLLRPDGRLIITTPNAHRAAPLMRAALPASLMLYLEDRVEHRGIDELEESDPELGRFGIRTHFHELSRSELCGLLRRHGLVVEEVSLLALKLMPNRSFNALARRFHGFVPAMERLDEATRHWPIDFFKTCLYVVARPRPH